MVLITHLDLVLKPRKCGFFACTPCLCLPGVLVGHKAISSFFSLLFYISFSFFLAVTSSDFNFTQFCRLVLHPVLDDQLLEFVSCHFLRNITVSHASFVLAFWQLERHSCHSVQKLHLPCILLDASFPLELCLIYKINYTLVEYFYLLYIQKRNSLTFVIVPFIYRWQ
jgi:hypothetical protein